MTKLIRSLILSAIIVLVLASCNALAASPTVDLTIQASPSSYSKTGETIKFSYTITSTGTVPLLDPIKVSSDKSIIVTCPAIGTPGNLDGILIKDEVIVCTGDYLTTQPDVDAKSVTINALVEEASTNGGSLTVQLGTQSLLPASPLTLTTTAINKVANAAAYSKEGDQITFKYVITNSSGGILPAAQFTVTDELLGTAPFNCDVPNKTLAPNDPNSIATCEAIYTIKAADLTAVSIANLASASYIGGTVTSQKVSATVQNTTLSNTTLTTTAINKAANAATYSKEGDQITFKYVITNRSATILGPAQFTVTDELLGPAPFNCDVPNKTLAPNDPNSIATCEAIYTITKDDLTAVSVANLASASYIGGTVTSQKVSATVTKSGVVQPNQNLTVGSTIQHKVVEGEWLWQIARCYGADPAKLVQANPQLPIPALIYRDMIVTVPNIGSVGKIYGIPCIGFHTVQSGDSWSSIALKYNADAAVLQMVNANTLTVGGVVKVPLNSAGGAVTGSKALTLTTTAINKAVNAATYSKERDQITFMYVITNSGTAILGPAQFTVTDELFGLTPFNCGGQVTLAPGGTVTCEAPVPYIITTEDLSAVSITNLATASGGGAGPSQKASAPPVIYKP